MRQRDPFRGDDAGSVYIDWVALTAGVILLGVLVVHEVYYAGIAGGALGADAAGDGGPAELAQGRPPER